ncbi:MAG: hypothetical protein MRY83_10415 [Flavobacteriales bacterium]|nr:hypothetical protein [Flavobacteriales bacterium]
MTHFEESLKIKINTIRNAYLLGLLGSMIPVGFLLYGGIKFGILPLTIMAFGLVLFLTLFYYLSRGSILGSSYWLNLIYESPDQIIWVKPFKVKERVALMPVDEKMLFKLYTIGKVSITFSFEDKYEMRTFRDQFMKLIPNAHFGYSIQAQMLYKKNPSTFISTLKSTNEYFALGALTIAS